MVKILNFLVFLALLGMWFMFKQIEWNWGRETMGIFALGWIAATIMWQSVHKMRYGHWFDPPTIEDDAPAPRAK